MAGEVTLTDVARLRFPPAGAPPLTARDLDVLLDVAVEAFVADDDRFVTIGAIAVNAVIELVAVVREQARAIIEAQANERMTEPCPFCRRGPSQDDHAPDCPMLRARALLGDTGRQEGRP